MKPEPPSPDDPTNPPPSKPHNAICGKKFQTMLSCVEKSGTVSACTHNINDFIACERAVFRAAIRNGAAQTPATAPPPQHLYPSHTPKPSVPALSPSHDASHAPVSAHPHGHQSFDLFSAPFASMERVVRKQMNACASLMDTIGRPQYQTQLLQFNRRMITDMRVTCEIIRSKALQFVARLSPSSSRSDDPAKPSAV